jgi:hypothetical protein
MTDTTTTSLGTDQVAAIDKMFGDATPVSLNDGSETDGDSADEYSDEPQVEAGDSEGVEEEPAAEEAQTTEAEPDAAAAAADRQAQIEKLAKEFGLDYNNERDRKIIDRMLTQDKRKADTDNYIKELKEKLDTSTFLTEWEKSLQQGDGKKAATAPTAPAARAAQGAGDEFNDGYNWKAPQEAITSLNEAYKSGDLNEINNIEAAIYTRRFHAIALPRVQHLVAQAIKDLTGRDLAPVLQQATAQREAQEDLEDRDFAIEELSKDPGMKKALELLQEAGEGTIEFGGKKYPNTAVRRIFAKKPEILDVRVNHPDPRTANKLTWMRRYRFAARELLEEQQQKGSAVPPVKQAKEIFQAGVDTAKKAGDQNRIRQAVNAGSSKGNGRPVSADNEFLAGLSRTSGTTGISASTLFRNK